MKPSLLVATLSLLLGTIVAMPIGAQEGAGALYPVPPTIHFQGYLRVDGVPVNGVRNLTLSILDADRDDANTLYSENFPAVNISTGFFEVALTPSGVDSWTSAEYYLNIYYNAAGGGNISPRIAIPTAAYALIASTAGTVTGRVRADDPRPHLIRGSLGVGVVPTTGEPLLDVAGAFEIIPGNVPPVSRPGESRLYFDPYSCDEREGICTGTGLLWASENGGSFVELVPQTFTQGGTAFDGASTIRATLGTNDAEELWLVTSGSDRMVITPSGNVGVATSAPVGLLTIGNGLLTVTSAGRVGVGTSQPTAGVTVVGGDVRLSTAAQAGPSALRFYDGSSLTTAAGAASVGGVASPGDVIIAADSDADGAGNIVLRTGSTDRVTLSTSGTVSLQGAPAHGGLLRVGTSLTVTPEGRVGIATTAPQGTLDVRGMILEPGSITNVSAVGNNTKVYTPAHSIPGLPLKRRFEVIGLGGAYPNGALAFTDTNLGIGTRSPNAALAVHGASTNALYVSADDTGAGGTAHLIVTGAGKVGIGTATPQSSLHVASGFVQIPTRTGSDPPSSDCSTAAHAGRLVSRADGASGSRLWVCLGTSGWISF